MVKTNTPSLRFPGFGESFESKIFDQILEITRLAGYEYSKYWQEDSNKEIIALRGYNIGRGMLELNNLAYISNELSLKLKRSRLYDGDIVYPCVGTIGNAVVIRENDKYHIQQNIAKLTPRKGISPEFITQFLMSRWGLKEVYRFNATSSQPNVLVSSLRNFKINLPSLPEQQKIAAFLSSVDQKIEQLSQKKALLEQYKKGMMQQLFSQTLRFKKPDGTDYPDWEEKLLGEVGSFKKGKGISKNDITEEGATECIRYGELYTDYSETISHVNSKTNLPTSELVLSENNDVIIPASGETQIDIATAACVQKEGVALGGDLNIIRTDLDGVFLSYYLNSAKKIDIARIAQGSSVVHLYPDQLSKIQLNIPLPEEQTRIASFLSAIDQKLAHLSEQLEQTQNFKKGLLQQMFV